MIKKLFTLCLSTLFVLSTALGQATYNLSFSPTVVGSKLRVQVDLSYDVAGKLGTSNFVFNYNNAALANPILFANNTPGPFYQTPTVTTPTSTTTSLNVELLVAGFGIDIVTTATNVATIEFDIINPTQMAGLVWRTTGTPRTEIFLDDNTTQLAVGTITNQADFPLSGGLPVELLSFTASALENETVDLQWQTSSENGNDYFLVERSVDGRNFENIDFVPGAGHSFELKSYESLDNRPNVGMNYYRLKQVDFTGTYQYSDIEVVEFKNPRVTINVFPNPTAEFINIERSEANESAQIQLFDQAGRIVVREAWPDGDFQKKLQLDELPKGIYMLTLNTAFEGKPIVHKIILQ